MGAQTRLMLMPTLMFMLMEALHTFVPMIPTPLPLCLCRTMTRRTPRGRRGPRAASRTRARRCPNPDRRSRDWARTPRARARRATRMTRLRQPP
eukprot:17933-Chlamydomonas_euryale.AAC.2